MRDYDFVLKFDLPNASADPADFLVALESGGCTDALVGIGQMGIVGLDFTREGASARDAVTGAVADVLRAIPGARLVEASPDLVGLTEVADILGFSRQYMRKLAYGSLRTFPVPIHEGRPSVWHLATILRWVQSHRTQDIDEGLVDVAELNMNLNIALSELEADPDEIERLRVMFA